jgi:hypothetical protein
MTKVLLLALITSKDTLLIITTTCLEPRIVEITLMEDQLSDIQQVSPKENESLIADFT